MRFPLHYAVSVKAVAAEMNRCGLSSSDRAVMFGLLAHEDGSFRAWVTVGMLSAHTGLHVNTVKRSIRSLRDLGWVGRLVRRDPGMVGYLLLVGPDGYPESGPSLRDALFVLEGVK